MGKQRSRKAHVGVGMAKQLGLNGDQLARLREYLTSRRARLVEELLKAYGFVEVQKVEGEGLEL